MNLQDQVVYRCIHAPCARLLPRKVNFCPYCGVSQCDGVQAPSAPAPLLAAVTPDQAAAALVMRTPTPAPSFTPPQPAPPPAPPPASAVPAAPATPIPPAARIPPPPRGPAAPPQRKPIRMRWWIIALAALAAIWWFTKPNKRATEERIDAALAMTRECKLSEAQGELIALRSRDAPEAQLRRVQKAINDASPGCEKKRVRARTWTETEVAVQKLIDDGQIAKAHARLTQFTRRHGEDEATRALKERIGPLPQPARPRSSAPESGELARNVLSARRLIDQAERDIQVGNYQAAADKMETCVTMVESGARECASFKVYADRLQAEMRRCVASGMEWIDRRCR